MVRVHGPETAMVDLERIERAVREMIEAIGEDPEREGLRETPRRVAEMYGELFSGLGRDPRSVLKTFYAEEGEDVVILRDIQFFSLCEHHFLPFFGRAHVGYLPNGAIAGLSKIPRAVEILARRPQVQERLTDQVAESILEALNAHGVAAVIEAEHFCLSMRGVNKPGTKVVTSAVRGDFPNGAATRAELLAMVQGRSR